MTECARHFFLVFFSFFFFLDAVECEFEEKKKMEKENVIELIIVDVDDL